MDAPTIDDIRAAAQRIDGALVRTPMLVSRTLSEIIGAEVWLKFENLQFTAAYKERGALNKLLLLNDSERKRGVIGRQPCAGGCLPRQAPGHPGDDRDAVGDADDQGDANRRARRARRPPR